MALQSPSTHVTTLPVPVVVTASDGAPDPLKSEWVAGVAASCAPVHTSTTSARVDVVPPNAAVTVTEEPPPVAVQIESRVVAPLVPTFTLEVNVSPVTPVWVWLASAEMSLATTIDPLGGVKDAVTIDVLETVSP